MTLTLGKSTLRGALLLLAFAFVGTFVLALTHRLTQAPILRAEEAAKRKLLDQVLPRAIRDNDVLQDALVLPPHALLGTAEPGQAFRARRGGAVTGVALEAIAPNGYSGTIRLIVGVAPDGRVLGVRVVSHNETPGLGDFIDVGRSDWIRRFDGRGLAGDAGAWRVRKDGGAFDAVTGATITSRAMVEAVRRALEYFAAHRDALLGANGQGHTS